MKKNHQETNSLKTIKIVNKENIFGCHDCLLRLIYALGFAQDIVFRHKMDSFAFFSETWCQIKSVFKMLGVHIDSQIIESSILLHDRLFRRVTNLKVLAARTAYFL